MQLLHFKVFHTICMHQFGWLSERGGNFLNLLQKEGVPRKGLASEKGGSNPVENCAVCFSGVFIEIRSQKFCNFLHEVRILSNLKYGAARFFGKKKKILRFSDQKAPKRLKIRFFRIYEKGRGGIFPIFCINY